MIVTILIFAAVLGLLVFVHELGHFIVAKKSGMDVHEFGFGFPPRLIGLYKENGRWRLVGPRHQASNSTVYSINWIPLGGFVKIAGENNDEPDNPNAFARKRFFPRLATLAAGVVMNFVLAWVLLVVGHLIGTPQVYLDTAELPAGSVIQNAKVVVADVEPGSPAQTAGLVPGDVLLYIDSEAVQDIDFVRNYTNTHRAQELKVVVERAGSTVDLVATPRAVAVEGQGPLGVSLANLSVVRFSFPQAVINGSRALVSQIGLVWGGLWSLVSGQQGLENLGGPARIAKITGDVADMGWPYLLQFTAFLSVNLGILNALPIPALDGGRILFLFIEKIRRRPNNPVLEQWVNAVGFFALIGLMIFVSWNDLKSFGGLGAVFHKIF